MKPDRQIRKIAADNEEERGVEEAEAPREEAALNGRQQLFHGDALVPRTSTHTSPGPYAATGPGAAQGVNVGEVSARPFHDFHINISYLYG